MNILNIDLVTKEEKLRRINSQLKPKWEEITYWTIMGIAMGYAVILVIRMFI